MVVFTYLAAGSSTRLSSIRSNKNRAIGIVASTIVPVAGTIVLQLRILMPITKGAVDIAPVGPAVRRLLGRKTSGELPIHVADNRRDLCHDNSNGAGTCDDEINIRPLRLAACGWANHPRVLGICTDVIQDAVAVAVHLSVRGAGVRTPSWDACTYLRSMISDPQSDAADSIKGLRPASQRLNDDTAVLHAATDPSADEAFDSPCSKVPSLGAVVLKGCLPEFADALASHGWGLQDLQVIPAMTRSSGLARVTRGGWGEERQKTGERCMRA